VVEQLERCRISPLQIVEDQDQRAVRRQHTEQLTHRAIAAKALLSDDRALALALDQGRED
jgi:hypothetical protein